MKLEHFNKEMINSLLNQKNIDTIELVLKEEKIETPKKIELINILYYLKLCNLNKEKIIVKSEKENFELDQFYVNLANFFEIDPNTDPGNMINFIKDSIETTKFLNKKYKKMIKNFEKEKKKLNTINKDEKKKIVEFVGQMQKKNSDLKQLLMDYERKNDDHNLEMKLKNDFKKKMNEKIANFEKELKKKNKLIGTLKQKKENSKFKFYSKIVFQNQIIKNLFNIINFKNQKSILPSIKNFNILNDDKSEIKSQISIILPTNQNISIKSDFANPKRNRLKSYLNKSNNIGKNNYQNGKDKKIGLKQIDKNLLDDELVKYKDNIKQRNNLEIKLMYYYKLSSHNEQEFFDQIKILNDEYYNKTILNIEEAIEFYLICKKFTHLKIEDTNSSFDTILKNNVVENTYDEINLKVLDENFKNGKNLHDILKKFCKMKEVIYFYTKNLTQREKQIQIMNNEIDENNSLIENLKTENDKNSKLLELQNDVKIRKIEEQNLFLEKEKINLVENIENLKENFNLLQKKFLKLENKNKLETEKAFEEKKRNEEKIKSLFNQVENFQKENFDFLKLKLELENKIIKLKDKNEILINSEENLNLKLKNLNKEKIKFLKQNEILEKKEENLSSNLEERKNEKLNLENKNEKLSLSLNQFKIKNEKIEFEKNNLEKEKEKLLEMIKNFEIEIEKKKNLSFDQKNNLEKEINELKNNLEQIQNEKNDLKLDLKKKQNENIEKNKELLKFEKQNQEIITKLNKVENEKNDLSINLKAIQEKEIDLKKNFDNLQDQKENLVKEKINLQKNIKEQKQTNETLILNEKSYTIQITNLSKIKENLETDKENLTKKKEKLENEKLDLEKVKESIVHKLDENVSIKNEFEKNIENLNFKISTLEKKIKDLESDIKVKTENISSFKKENEKLNMNLEILQEEKKIFIEQIKEKNELITKCTDEIKNQVSNNSQLQDYLKENKEILNLLKNEKNKERGDLEKDIEKKDSIISDKQSFIKDLKEEIKDFKEKIKNLEKKEKMKNEEYLKLKKELKNQKKTNINVYKENEEKMENMENDLIGVEERINEIKDQLKNFDSIKSEFKDKNSQFKNIIIWLVNKFEDLKMLYNDLLHSTTLKIMDLHQDKLKLLKMKLKQHDFNFEKFIENKELRRFLANILNIDVDDKNNLFFDNLNNILQNSEILDIYSVDLNLAKEKSETSKSSALIKDNLQTLTESYNILKQTEKTEKLSHEEIQEFKAEFEKITNFYNALKTIYSSNPKYEENFNDVNFHMKIMEILNKKEDIDINEEKQTYLITTLEEGELLKKYNTFIKEIEEGYDKKVEIDNLYTNIINIISAPLKIKYDHLQCQYKETLFLNDKATSKFLQFRDDIMRLNGELEEKEMIILKLEQSKNVKISKSPSLMKKKTKSNANCKNKNQKKLISEMEKKLAILKNILRAMGINPKEKNLNQAFLKRVEELKINKDDLDFTVFKAKTKRKEKNFTRYGEELQSFLQVSEKNLENINLFKEGNSEQKKVPFFLDNSVDSLVGEPNVDSGSEKNNVFIKDYKRSNTKN